MRGALGKGILRSQGEKRAKEGPLKEGERVGAPAVVGSYLNLTIAGWVLALALIALTRGRLGYRQEAVQEPRVR
jgi:hypothetical protein